MAKTKFTSDLILDSMSAVSTPSEQQDSPAHQEPPKLGKAASAERPSQPAAVVKARTEPCRKREKAEVPASRQQLNIELDDELYYALNLRKALAKKDRDDSENSFKKIVEASLRAYLSSELQEGRR